MARPTAELMTMIDSFESTILGARPVLVALDVAHKLPWPARLGLALMVVAAVGVLGPLDPARAAAKPDDKTAKPAGQPQAASVPAPPRAIDVTVRAKDTGKPIEGASVRPSIGMETKVMKANRDGQVRIILFRHATRDSLSFDVWAEGYVQQRHFFAQNDARYPKIPGSVTVELSPAEQTLGGTVTDDQGRPIRGVKVDVWGYLGEKKQKEELAYMVDATTDDQGRWRCRCFRGMQFAYLYLSHPDYLADDSMHPRRHGRPRPSDPPRPGEKPMEPLRDFSDVQVMMRGIEVAGEVRDEQVKPIPDAEVGWLEAQQHHTFHQDMPTTTTDALGRFRFANARPGGLVLQVKARGHSPELKSVDAKAGSGPVTIVLGPARTLAGRVVDSRGQPIFGAFVGIDTWRTYRSLGVFLETDETGRFRWVDAPPDSVLINASSTGFNSIVMQRASPDEEAILTLKRALAISGRIRDAKTNKPVDNVSVDFGTPGSKPGAFTWARNNRVFSFQGYLQASVDIERTPEFRLRFQAKGYKPFESRTFRGDERQVEYNVNLTPID
ncbi:MAG: carboxypeptidase regulatory-like domain-containing protein [Isosphaeraceae bacterium]